MTRPALDVIADLHDAFASGDPDRIGSVLHPDFEIEQPGSFTHGGRYVGLAGMGEMGAAFAAHWDRSIENPRAWADGDKVFQLTTQTWTSKATGRSATVDVFELITIADDKILEIRVFQQDAALLLATLV